MNNHKPMCKINMNCAVVHTNGICPDKVCTCGVESIPNNPNNKENKCKNCGRKTAGFEYCQNAHCEYQKVSTPPVENNYDNYSQKTEQMITDIKSKEEDEFLTKPTPQSNTMEEKFRALSSLVAIHKTKDPDNIVEYAMESLLDTYTERITSQVRKETIRECVNTKELEKDWEKNFYESAWEPNTLKYTETEKKIVEELGIFLPRHMIVYDWNLPYADEIILIIRRHLSNLLSKDIEQ